MKNPSRFHAAQQAKRAHELLRQAAQELLAVDALEELIAITFQGQHVMIDAAKDYCLTLQEPEQGPYEVRFMEAMKQYAEDEQLTPSKAGDVMAYLKGEMSAIELKGKLESAE